VQIFFYGILDADMMGVISICQHNFSAVSSTANQIFFALDISTIVAIPKPTPLYHGHRHSGYVSGESSSDGGGKGLI